MKINGFSDAVKNKPNQTQLQTNHPNFQIFPPKPIFSIFYPFSSPFSFVFCRLSSILRSNPDLSGASSEEIIRRYAEKLRSNPDLSGASSLRSRNYFGGVGTAKDESLIRRSSPFLARHYVWRVNVAGPSGGIANRKS